MVLSPLHVMETVVTRDEWLMRGVMMGTMQMAEGVRLTAQQHLSRSLVVEEPLLLMMIVTRYAVMARCSHQRLAMMETLTMRMGAAAHV